MQPRMESRSLMRSLLEAEMLLEKHANRYPGIRAVCRALKRIASRVDKPFRVAILGESNSGKSSIANLLAGEIALPALPVANTRIPTLLRYGAVPAVEALHENGQRSAVTSSDTLPLKNIIRLEVGLPRKALSSLEVLDFPGSANPLFQMEVRAVLRHRVDAAVWATGATQAWRETERVAWCGLPERLRRRGLLAVTHRDLITSEEDFRRLRTRLEGVAKTHFSALCFVGASGAGARAIPGGQPGNNTAEDLRLEVEKLRSGFQKERIEKAVSMTRRLASNALALIE